MREFARRSIAKNSEAAKMPSNLEPKGRGLVCLSLPLAVATRIGVKPMVIDGESSSDTLPFGVPISVKNTQSPFSTSTRCSNVRSRR